jgi:hypothetical protein
MSRKPAAKRAAPRKNGRPSSYTKAIATDICVRLANGEPITKIVKLPGMPSLPTVYRWLDADKPGLKRPPISAGFREQYARAKLDAAETLAAEIVEISDDRGADSTVATDKEGNPRILADPVAVQRDRLRIDARKWYAAKLNPKKYGDKIQQEVTGADGGPVQTVTTVVEDVQARLQAIRAKIQGVAPKTGG